jgi:hypothetical protein
VTASSSSSVASRRMDSPSSLPPRWSATRFRARSSSTLGRRP